MSEVRLRPIEADDIATIAAFLAHPDLVGRRGLDRDPPVARSVAALTAAVEPLVESKHGLARVVDAGGVVGLVMIDWWWDALVPWAHIAIDPDHQRRGHGTAAALLTLDHLFHTTPATLVQYAVPSWDGDGLAFAESLGGEQIGRNRRTGIRAGAYFDSVEFVMPRKAWEVNRAARR